MFLIVFAIVIAENYVVYIISAAVVLFPLLPAKWHCYAD